MKRLNACVYMQNTSNLTVQRTSGIGGQSFFVLRCVTVNASSKLEVQPGWSMGHRQERIGEGKICCFCFVVVVVVFTLFLRCVAVCLNAYSKLAVQPSWTLGHLQKSDYGKRDEQIWVTGNVIMIMRIVIMGIVMPRSGQTL